MSETVTQYRTLTLDQSLALARWYANGMCVVKPERYETYSETAEGTSRLSDAVRVIVDALVAAQERIAELEVEKTRALAANERDRTGYARMVNSLYLHVQRWSGIASSRGPYEWDDEEYHREFGRCLTELRKIAERGGRHSHAFDTHDCPTTQAAVDAARARLPKEGAS